MKKFLAILLCTALLFALAIPAMAAVTLTAAKGTAVIDGVRDDCYGDPVDVKAWRDGTTAASGAWATVWASWDNNYIYYYMEVYDTTPNHDHDTDHQTDNVEFFIDWFNTKEDNSSGGSPYFQIRIHSDPGPQEHGNGTGVTGAANQDWGRIGMDVFENMKHVIVPLNGSMNNGYIIEIAIAKADVEGGITLAEGMTMGIDFAIADNQDGTERASHAFIMENDDNDQQWQMPSACGGLLVLGAVKPAPAAASSGDAASAGADGGGADAAAEPDVPAPAPTQAATTSAPRTADPVSLIIIGSLISAAGVVIAKKRK